MNDRYRRHAAVRISRRSLLWGAGATTAALVSGCGGPVTPPATAARPSASGTRSIATAFADPWRGMFEPAAQPFARRALLDAPQSVDHARERLSVEVTTSQRRAVLSIACTADLLRDDVVVVGGWTVPTTLAGLLAALVEPDADLVVDAAPTASAAAPTDADRGDVLR